jgi:hypothetical protein
MKQKFHVIDALLQNKANPNDINISGWNCLISAINYFHEDSAIMLLLLLQVLDIFFYNFKTFIKIILFFIKPDRC